MKINTMDVAEINVAVAAFARPQPEVRTSAPNGTLGGEKSVHRALGVNGVSPGSDGWSPPT